MADVNQEVKELKEKIEFCSYVMKYGRLIDMSSDQTVKAFKLKCELEDELRFIELKNKMEANKRVVPEIKTTAILSYNKAVVFLFEFLH